MHLSCKSWYSDEENLRAHHSCSIFIPLVNPIGKEDLVPLHTVYSKIPDRFYDVQ